MRESDKTLPSQTKVNRTLSWGFNIGLPILGILVFGFLFYQKIFTPVYKDTSPSTENPPQKKATHPLKNWTESAVKEVLKAEVTHGMKLEQVETWLTDRGFTHESFTEEESPQQLSPLQLADRKSFYKWAGVDGERVAGYIRAWGPVLQGGSGLPTETKIYVFFDKDRKVIGTHVYSESVST
jgi:hypothetical protein